MAAKKRSWKVKRYVRSMRELKRVNAIQYWKAYYHAESIMHAYRMLKVLDPRITKPYVPEEVPGSSKAQFVEATSSYSLNRCEPYRLTKSKTGYWYAEPKEDANGT